MQKIEHAHDLLFKKNLDNKNLISQPLDLIAVNHIPDEITLSRKYIALMEFTFKLPHRANIFEHMPMLIEIIRRAEKLEQIDLIAATVHYLMDRIDMDKDLFLHTIFKPLQQKTGEKIMTIAQQLRNEGFEKGIQKGIEKGIEKVAKNLLKQNYSIQEVKKLTTLSEMQIIKLYETETA